VLSYLLEDIKIRMVLWFLSIGYAGIMNLEMVMLTGFLKVIFNKLFLKSFNTIFMENIKKLSKKSITFLFFNKNFLKIISKPISLKHGLTFSFIKNNPHTQT